MAQPYRLKILLGSHDRDMVGGVMRHMKDCNMLFLEYLDTKSKKLEAQVFANNMTLPGRYDPARYDEQQIMAAADAYQQIIWRLRKTNVLVRLVDRTFDDKHPAKLGDFGDTIDGSMRRSLIRRGNWAKLYRGVNRKLDHAAVEVRARDELVAVQVTDTLKQFRADYPKLPITAALVQGFMHRSAPHIKRLMPELEIETHYYNTRLNAEAIHHAGSRLLEAKVRRPDEPADPQLIDSLFIVLADLALAPDDDFEELPPTSTSVKAMPEWPMMLATFKRLEKLSPDAVHMIAEQRLEQLRANK